MPGILTPRGPGFYPRGLIKPTNPVLDPAHPLSRGLVGCWLLGESVSRTTDISGNGNHGVGTASPPLISSHHGGMASSFNGSSQYFTIANAPAVNLVTFTLGAWVKTSGSGNRCIISKEVVNFRNYYLAARNSGKYGIYFTQGSSNFKGFDGSISVTSNWTFVVATYDGATIRLFVDGVADGTAAATGSPDQISNSANIGIMGGTVSEPFSGSIEGARMYNRALSVPEILLWKAEPYAGIYNVSPQYVVGAGGSGPVSVALTGISATGSVGSLGVRHTNPLTGNAATGSVGTLRVLHTNPLTGISATGSLGTLTPYTAYSKALTGNQATGSVGTLGVRHTNPLTGISATGSLGTLTPLSGYFKALTGISGTGSVGSLGVVHTNPLTGLQATGLLGTLTPVTTGGSVSVALTGISATGYLGTLSPPAATGQGGHFIPLTEKQLRELKKKQRRDQQIQDNLDHSRKLDADAIEADIRSTMSPAKPGAVISPKIVVETTQDEDEDEDLELILLNA